MVPPVLVNYDTWQEYKEHYLNKYCRSVIITFDGIRVYFSPDTFGHAFRESSGRNGVKDTFSTIRMQRIDWILAALTNKDAELFCGWDKKSKTYRSNRRVSVVYVDFVVVIEISRREGGLLKANFKTCYRADVSIDKIKKSPRWTLADFLKSSV